MYKFVDTLLVHQQSFIFWPCDPTHLARVKRRFLLQQGFPNCCGAIDVTHVNMDKLDWFDWLIGLIGKHNYSMCVQCVVDMDLRFVDVFTGWPGSSNDKRVLRNSSFFHCVERGIYLNGPPFVRDQFSLREFIVGDGEYMLRDWCMIPYVLPRIAGGKGNSITGCHLHVLLLKEHLVS